MASLTITWTLRHHGWAFIKVADDHGESQVFASYVTDGPEQFLYAIARLVSGDEDARAEFEGEPQVYRWFFHRDGSDVDIRLVEAKDLGCGSFEGKGTTSACLRMITGPVRVPT